MTIAEVSKKYGLTQDTIRYIEKQEDIKKTLERLNYKIELYDDIISGKRKDFMEEP